MVEGSPRWLREEEEERVQGDGAHCRPCAVPPARRRSGRSGAWVEEERAHERRKSGALNGRGGIRFFSPVGRPYPSITEKNKILR